MSVARTALLILAVSVALGSSAPVPAAGVEPSIGVARGPSRDLDIGPLPPPADTTHILVANFDLGPTCDNQGWAVVDLTAGTGDFGVYGALFPGLAVLQEDPCYMEFSCLWGFFDGSPEGYACGGYPSQPAVPHGGIHNEIQSPPRALSGGGSRIEVAFDVYRDLDLDGLVFYTLRVRSYFADVGGPWHDRGLRYYGPTGGDADRYPDWYQTVIPIGDLVEPGATGIAIAIGVVDMGALWSGSLGSGICHSHAPLVDNVYAYVAREHGPQWFVDPADLFQDAFPADGTATGTVRADIARDIEPRAATAAVRAGDSLVVSVSEPTVGLAYHSNGVPATGPAVYLHVRDVAPGKSGSIISGDAARWPVASTGGGWTVLQMDSVRDAAGTPLSSRQFCVDLDDALYTPGDTIAFFFSARDASDRTTYWTEFTATTDAMSTAQSYPMEMTCLPAVRAVNLPILYIDGADGTGAQPYFDSAFQMFGIEDWVDRYDIRAPDGLVGNGPGTRAVDVARQVAPYYDIVIWNTGDLAYGGFGDGTGQPDKSPDAQFLLEFLRNNATAGGVYLSGDDLCERLVRGSGATLLAPFIDFRLDAANHSSGLGISPYMIGAACSPFSHATGPDTLLTYGGCPTLNDFDVIEPAGIARTLALYSGSGRTAGAIVGQTTPNDAGWGQRVVLSGFSYHVIRDDRSSPIPDRAHHLADIVAWIKNEIDPPVGIPPPITMQVVDEGVQVEWETTQGSCEDEYRIRIYRLVHTDTVWDIIGPDSLLPANGTLVDTGAVAGVRNWYRLAKHYGTGGLQFSSQESVDVPLDERRFSARSAARGIELAWSVGSHRTLRGVRLLRAEGSAGVFAPLLGDSLLAAGDGRYLDTSAETGMSYAYKLALVFTDDSVVESPIRTLSYTPALALLQNAPNPMGPSTRLPFMLPQNAEVSITIYDVAGRRVATLQSGTRPAGYNEVVWDGRLANGSRAASGIYFYRLQTLGQTLTRKMVIVR